MLHPEDRDRVVQAWQESVVQGTPYHQEERHRGADGTYRWFLSRGVPLRDAEGRVTRWYGTNTDIEDRKRAEWTLSQREEYLRVLLEHVPVGVYTCNQEGLIEYYNPRAVEIWGRAPVMRDPMQRYCGSFALFHTDGTPMPFEENIMAQVVRTGIPQGNQEVVIGRPDGTRLIALVNVAPLRNERGEIIGAVNCMLDISSRKQAEDALRESEARSRLLITSSNIGPWDWNLVTNEIFYSAEWKSQLGYADDEVSDRYEEWESRLHPEDREPALRAVQDFREGRRHDYHIEFRLRHKNGSWRSILTRADLIRDAAGQPVRMLGCHIDITERKKAERQIEHFAELFQALSHRLLEVQEEERRHLARELHDEIGQALTAAKLNLKIIAPEVPPAAAGRLEDSIQVLDRLLQQVRQLSLDLRPPLLDELGLVPALRWLADQQAQRAGMRITFTANVERLEMDLPVRTACFRVAQEAITNAIRHARAATVAVELRAEPNRVWLVVKDDGGGFDKDAMQQRAAGGASIGLLSMNERASLLGGRLEVSSAPGLGTEIRAWFPLAPPGLEATRVS
jgi:PAS domain S-box-containing protein